MKPDSILYKVRRGMARMTRLARSRGYGVQSPWAYNLVRNVFCKRMSHSVYGNLKHDYPLLKPSQRRRMELCLRLSDYLQPSVWLDKGEQQAVCERYVHAGCEYTNYISYASMPENVLPKADVIRIKDCFELVEDDNRLLKSIHDETILVIDDIRSSAEMCLVWKQIRDSEHTGVTFDLYDCGIVFFDKKMYKQKYDIIIL